MSCKRYNKGFSLLEVLVAFTIAAMSLGVLFQIYAKGTTSAILGEEYAQAIVIAESKLAEVGISENLEISERTGLEYNKYNWYIIARDYIEDSPSDFTSNLSLKEVTVEVYWNSQRNQRSIKLHTLKPAPAS
ncbi:MAG: prepilin-type N-terminal cleavage/methylation domain-containing protein [Gammaproteobacteria bacterium]|nr:prepilin-type N-terminal cleavage/methylation domain-containing protein [Gammaproteobacteria bacterium]